ncbi:hypothetical protein Taro_003477 [Colocasia esculenta]|uniref:Uncharacterized protein n=1 Tax=Colocasia esculenta TaxID=4460 RepID=A0A843TRU4_COLES|nr:hypothetical protein [Colocasia esculenta]
MSSMPPSSSTCCRLSRPLLLLLPFLLSFLHGSSSNSSAGAGVIVQDAAAEGGKASIIFATVGRSRYAFDIFTLPVPPLPPAASFPYSNHTLDRAELLLTDGRSVNYNGFFPRDPCSLISLILSSSSCNHSLLDPKRPSEALVYISEREGSPSIYVDVYPSRSSDRGGAGRGRRAILQDPARLQVPLLRGLGDAGVSLKDKPSVSGEHLIYVSTHEASSVPRKSWTAVYSTHIHTGETRRLTPPGVADFSPAVSPSGQWTAVASSSDRGYTGETRELRTHVAVFRTRDGSERTVVIDHGGWPSWADDSTLFFHRECEDGWWSIFKATIGEGSDVPVERVTPPGFHAFTPAVGNGFVAMATRRPSSSKFRHIELLDLHSGVFVELTAQLSPNFHHYNPFISPDFTRIGYHRCRSSRNSGSSGSGPFLLENIKSPDADISLFRIDGSFPSFSHDGRQIAYTGLPGLHVMNSDGSGERLVLSGNAFATAWDWKRKGVIYTSYGPHFAAESTEVDVISITLKEEEEEEEGGPVSASIKKLTVGAKNNAFPSPSPDGKWVVFRSGRSGHKNLYTMDAVEGESGGLHRLTDGPWTDTMCSWSPDGEWIAFASDRDDPGSGSFSIYLVHPNGTGLRKVVQSGHGGRANHPYFSPDSKRIVFTSDYAGVSAEIISTPHQFQPYGEIFTANIDGSDIRRLTHNPYEDGTPTWAPAAMKPADVLERLPAGAHCKFDDCHWLNQQVRSEHRVGQACGHS